MPPTNLTYMPYTCRCGAVTSFKSSDISADNWADCPECKNIISSWDLTPIFPAVAPTNPKCPTCSELTARLIAAQGRVAELEATGLRWMPMSETPYEEYNGHMLIVTRLACNGIPGLVGMAHFSNGRWAWDDDHAVIDLSQHTPIRWALLPDSATVLAALSKESEGGK